MLSPTTTLNLDLPTLLLPDYSVIPKSRMQSVSRAVFAGEQKYRAVLESSGGAAKYGIHPSGVHSYRDLETQAFVMAYHRRNAQTSMLASFWTYLTHWFDDHFDDRFPAELAAMNLGEETEIEAILQALDPLFVTVWSEALALSRLQQPFDESLLRLGMRRMIMGAPMFSPKVAEKNDEARREHVRLLLRHLRPGHDVEVLVRSLHPNFLAHTARGVEEIWSSFEPGTSFELSFLMSCYYAPATFFHDDDEEREHAEISPHTEIDGHSIATTMQRIFACIHRQPDEDRCHALRPLPMIIDTFRPALTKSGLLGIYIDSSRSSASCYEAEAAQ